MRAFLILIFALAAAAAAAFAWVFWSAARGLDPASLEARRMTQTDYFRLVDGLRVRIREEGPEGAPPIVLLHGFIFSLESFDAWAGALSKSRRVIRYDLAGHGLTGPDPLRRYSPDERAEFHLKVMDALGVERADLAGNSLGGLIAWRFAAAHPERVGKLILIDAGGYSINGVAETPVEAPAAMKAFLATAPQAGVASTFAFVFGDDSKIAPERLALARDMMRRRGNGEAFIQHLDEFTLPDPEPLLSKVSAPTLIQWGGADALIPADHAARFDAAIDQSTVILYEGAGHAPHEEVAERTVADAEDFLTASSEGL